MEATTPEDAGGEETPPKIKSSTLEEYGPRLCIGVADPAGDLQKAMETRTWRMKEERELGRLRDQQAEEGGANMAAYISMVLASLCPGLAGKTMTASDMDRVTIGAMFMPDVFHAYCWLRFKTLGRHLPMKLKSPYTKKEFEWTADLGTVIIRSVEKVEDAFWKYELENPIEIRGKTVRSMLLGPPRWNSIEMLDPGTGQGMAKSEIIHASIYECPDVQEGPVALSPSELDNMTKPDIESLAKGINDNGIGPRMVLDVEDPTLSTKRTFEAPLDWSWDSFFGSSSR